MPELKAEDLKIGRWYRAKKPAPARGQLGPVVNDREIIWMGNGLVQYDGPAVRDGQHFPRVFVENFLKWAHRDVTDELPPGDWETWESYREVKARA